jgi:hypothetical protein
VLYKPQDNENAMIIGTRQTKYLDTDQELDIGKWHPNLTPHIHSILRRGQTFAFIGPEDLPKKAPSSAKPGDFLDWSKRVAKENLEDYRCVYYNSRSFSRRFESLFG